MEKESRSHVETIVLSESKPLTQERLFEFHRKRLLLIERGFTVKEWENWEVRRMIAKRPCGDEVFKEFSLER